MALAEAASKEDIRELAALAYEDPAFFCKFFLPHWFTTDLAWVHLGLLAILTRKCSFLLKYPGLDKIEQNFVWKENPKDNKSPEHRMFNVTWEGDNPVAVQLIIGQFTMVMIPRGFGKTTVVNAAQLYKISYNEREFPVYVSETATHSDMQLGNIKSELECNERLIAVFGQQKPEQRQGLKWSEDMIETTGGVTAVSRGRNAQIRGLNNKGHRPDEITLDDVEDKESVKTDVQREKTRNWFYSDVKPALAALKGIDATITVVGTLLHEDAMLRTLQGDEEWTAVVLGALDKDGEPLWPENMSVAKLNAIKRSYTRAGQLSSYYMEYFNTIRVDDDALFKTKYIIYAPAPLVLHRAIAVDPAISDQPGAHVCAFAVVGMEETGLIHIMDVTGGIGLSPRDQVNEYFRLVFKHDPQQYGVEAIAYQASLIHLLREEMFRRHRYFEIVPIRHKTKKTERIRGVLQPRYSAGYVRHNLVFPELETQLLDYPNGPDDYVDVVAMAITLLDPYAAQAADPDVDLADDEYDPLDKALPNRLGA